jgi:hypothetical protein
LLSSRSERPGDRLQIFRQDMSMRRINILLQDVIGFRIAGPDNRLA